MMKKTALLAATFTALAGSSFANADTAAVITPPTAQDNHRIVVAIQELGNRIEGLSKASVESVNELAYQLDKSFTSSMQLNNKQQDVQNRVRDQVRLETDRSIKRNLQPFSAATLTYTNKSQPEVKKVNAEITEQTNFINRLKNVEASDTIYSLVQGMDISSYWTKKNLGAPGRDDDSFNFSVLVEPEAYTPEQVKNSENFIGYATKQYQPFTDGVHLSQLRGALLQSQKQGVKTLSQQIDQFRNNEAYKNYQMTVRSMTATKSVATDIFAGLAAERKPLITTSADPQLDAISRAIGVEPQTFSLKNADGETITMYRYASPLQISSYRANYRLNDPKWYQEVASDSSENLLRKNTLLLAEISQQLHQAHLDSEKVQGALAMLNLQSGEAASMMLKTQINDVNSAISAFANSINNSNTQNTTAASSTTSPDASTYNTSNVSTDDMNAAASTGASPPPASP
jgi:hypothetical protein